MKARSTRSWRASRVHCFCSRPLSQYVAQVWYSAAGTKITNTGTNLADGPVTIAARALRPSARPSEDNRRFPRAQVSSGTSKITVSSPGKAEVEVRDQRPSRPPARKRRNFETQALSGVEAVTFKCYGEDVTVDELEKVVCNGPP